MDPEDEEDFDGTENFDDTEDQDQQVEDQQDEEDDQQEPPEDQQDEEAAPSRKPSRAQARIEALDREVRESREREAALARQIEELRNGQTRTSTEQQQREERERLERMDPLERAEHIARQTEQRTNQAIGTLSRQIADSTDRASFAEACATNPALLKVKDQVETELAKLRQSNVNMPRETLAAYLIGKSVLSKAPKARDRAAKRAAANLDRERARPAGGASDAPSRGRANDDKAARDKRLEGYVF